MKIIRYKTYLSMVKKSIGSKMFQNLFVEVDGKKEDILMNGRLSCAFYVSGILLLNRLIKELHATVDGLERDLNLSGWMRTKHLRPGYVIIWEKKTFPNVGTHRHIGFYVGNHRAISNHSEKHYPLSHDYLMKAGGRIRKIERIYCYPHFK